MSTPGHGGRICASPGYWNGLELFGSHYNRGWCVRDRDTKKHILYIWYCPAEGCGLKLVPDPEPLPVPDGFGGPVRSAKYGSNSWRCEIGDLEYRRGPWLEVVTEDQAACEALWRKLFTK